MQTRRILDGDDLFFSSGNRGKKVWNGVEVVRWASELSDEVLERLGDAVS